MSRMRIDRLANAIGLELAHSASPGRQCGADQPAGVDNSRQSVIGEPRCGGNLGPVSLGCDPFHRESGHLPVDAEFVERAVRISVRDHFLTSEQTPTEQEFEDAVAECMRLLGWEPA